MDDFAFRNACRNGHFETAKWLLDVKPDINVFSRNDFAFENSCRNGFVKIAEWIEHLYPWLYKIIKN